MTFRCLRLVLVPTLRVGTIVLTALRSLQRLDAERPKIRSHGDRGNENREREYE